MLAHAEERGGGHVIQGNCVLAIRDAWRQRRVMPVTAIGQRGGRLPDLTRDVARSTLLTFQSLAGEMVHSICIESASVWPGSRATLDCSEDRVPKRSLYGTRF